MSMSRKDYVKFAAMYSRIRADIKANPLHCEDAELATVDALIIQTADIFALDNPNFDRSRFYAACE